MAQRPFERIKVGDEENLALFLEHKAPKWKIPVYQQVVDWISGLTLLGVLLSLGIETGFKMLKGRRSKTSA